MIQTVLLGILLATIPIARCDRHNIILILTDDQDLCMDSLLPMENVKHLIGEKGTTFINAFTTSPICCPSRASILTGLHAHNHQTFNNSRDGGCYGEYWNNNIEGTLTFPSVLKKNGYKTFYGGKYLNQYHGKKVPADYDVFYGLQGNSKYYNFTLNINGKIEYFTDGQYLTDVLLNASTDFVNEQDSSPFFMIIAPPAPHAPFTPSSEFINENINMVVPRTPNFNTGSAGKHWLLSMQPTPLPNATLELIDDNFKNRWRTLLSVDKLVGNVVKALELKNLIDNTYIFYTSDNGYHLGQFSQPWDKRQPYECDIRVPLLIRGPGISPKKMNEEMVALLDIGPTILELTGIEPGNSIKFDGLSFASYIKTSDDQVCEVESLEANQMVDPVKKITRENLLIEYWGEGNELTHNPDCPWKVHDRLNQCDPVTGCKCQDSWNNTYSCIRNIEPDFDYLYCRFKDHQNFIEGYNLLKDPYQLNNIGSTDLPSIRAHFDLMIDRLQNCTGKDCYTQ